MKSEVDPAEERGNIANVIHELDWTEPTFALDRLADQPKVTFLDSAIRHEKLGRYSYIACDPFGTYVIADGHASWNGEALFGDPFEALRNCLAMYCQEHDPDLPPFQGGAAGFFAYDLNQTLDHMPHVSNLGQRTPQSMLNFYDTVIAWDHLKRRQRIVSTGWPEQDSVRRQARARRRAEELIAILFRPTTSPRRPRNAMGQWSSNFTRESYLRAVQRVIGLNRRLRRACAPARRTISIGA
jgi:para-aminobenzoate synthetase component 1